VGEASEEASEEASKQGRREFLTAGNNEEHRAARMQGLPAGCPPLPTEHVVLPTPIPVTNQLKIEQFYYQFFHHHPELWVKYNADVAGNIKDIARTYLVWSKMVKDRKKRMAGENKALKVESARERLERKVKERAREAELAVQREWTAIQRPEVDDEKRLLPTTRASHLVRSTVGQEVTLSKDAETALELLMQSFVEDTVGFSVAMARRRPRERGKELNASDAALFMSRMGVILPLADREVRGYVCNTTLPRAKAAREVVAAARRENMREGAGGAGQKK